MIVGQEKTREIIQAIRTDEPFWQRDSFYPSILIIRIQGPQFVIVDGDGLVFKEGHLSRSDWWEFGGGGAVLDSDYEILTRTGRSFFSGFIHFFCPNELSVLFGKSNPLNEAIEFFRAYPHELSAFYPVVFIRNNFETDIWRAIPRRIHSISQIQDSYPTTSIV